MKEINASPGRVLQLGYESEDNVTKIIFRYGEEWLAHGNGVFKIRVLRHGDTEAYNATEVIDDREGMTLTMTVTDIELSVKGHGEMQIVYVGADFVKKSPIYRYNVSRAIDSGVVDPPESSVINEIIESLAGIRDEIGTLDRLTTTDKSDLVSAINEVNAKEVTVDSELSGVSENPVQNKVIKARFDDIDQTVAGIGGRLATAETALEGKANTADVNTALSAKANTSDVNAALSVKADKSYVDTELAGKANSADVNTALSAKANSSDVNNALALKANTADMNTALALKANSADVQTALASKADKTYVDAEIDSVQEDLNGKAPAVLESVSGSVVSFEDGAELPAESVIAHIEPQQDLHGYDNPWPAGGGKNKLDPSTASALGTTVWFCEPNGFLFKSGVSYTFSVSNIDDVSSIAIYSTDKSTQLAYSTGSSRQSVTYTPTEDTYGLPRLYRNTPITQAIVDGAMIEIGSARTTYAPYSNICPITGWTGAKVTRCGKNLFDSSSPYNFGNNYIVFGGTAQFIYNTYLKAGTYTISVDGVSAYMYCRLYGTTQNVAIKSRGESSASFTITTSGMYAFWLYSNAGDIRAEDVNYVQIELGTTATAYEPYQGETYDITFPSEAGTVYSGSITVNEDGTGQLVVDRVCESKTWGDLTNAVGLGENERRKFTLEHTPKFTLINAADDTRCNVIGVYSAGYSMDTIHMYIANTDYAWIYMAKNTAASTEIQLSFTIAEPIVYELTALEVLETLKGVNNIWANCGAVSVTYRADTKTYVDNAIPSVPVQDVQVDGTSIVNDGVAEIPIAGTFNYGAVKVDSYYGISMVSSGTRQGTIQFVNPTNAQLKAGDNNNVRPSVSQQHISTFYGLAKAAGDSTQSASNNAVGTYTETAKSKISDMLNGAVTVSGTTPTITALSGVRYVCGEVATLDITPCASGICDIVFTSGSTATVLTLPNAVKFPDGAFTPEANTTYEINILDGVYGVVMAWT